MTDSFSIIVRPTLSHAEAGANGGAVKSSISIHAGQLPEALRTLEQSIKTQGSGATSEGDDTKLLSLAKQSDILISEVFAHLCQRLTAALAQCAHVRLASPCASPAAEEACSSSTWPALEDAWATMQRGASALQGTHVARLTAAVEALRADFADMDTAHKALLTSLQEAQAEVLTADAEHTSTHTALHVHSIVIVDTRCREVVKRFAEQCATHAATAAADKAAAQKQCGALLQGLRHEVHAFKSRFIALWARFGTASESVDKTCLNCGNLRVSIDSVCASWRTAARRGEGEEEAAQCVHAMKLLWEYWQELRIAGGDLRIAGGELRIAGGDPRIAGGELRIAKPWKPLLLLLDKVLQCVVAEEGKVTRGCQQALATAEALMTTTRNDLSRSATAELDRIKRASVQGTARQREVDASYLHRVSELHATMAYASQELQVHRPTTNKSVATLQSLFNARLIEQRHASATNMLSTLLPFYNTAKMCLYGARKHSLT